MSAPLAAAPRRPLGARLLDAGAWLVALAALAVVVSPLWRDLTSWASSIDARASWFALEVDRVTLTEHHELPLWNPYACGGLPQLASPETSTLSPLTALVVFFGTPLGFRLGVTLGLLTALLSLRAWARTLGLSAAASTLAGAGFAVCGAFALHAGAGQWSWLGFALHPLLLRSLHLALAGRRAHLAWGALAFACIIFQSPTDPTRLAVVLVVLYAIFLGLWGPAPGPPDARARLRSVARALGAAAVMLGLGAALAAVRLLPLRELLAAHQRLVDDRDFTSPRELLTTYATRYTDRALGHHAHPFPELGNYFGWIGLGLALAGLVFVLARRRALAPVAAGAIACVLLQTGGGAPLPWGLLKHLPATGSFGVPARFTILAGMFLCVLIGAAVDAWGTPALTRDAKLPAARRALGLGVLALALAYLFDAASWNRQPFAATLGAPAPVEEARASFRLVAGDANHTLLYPRLNEGSLRCREEPAPTISPRLRPGLPVEEYLADPRAGSVWRVSWSPDRIVLHVDVDRQTVVFVNQNDGPGWRALGGELVPSFGGGLLAAEVLPGERILTFLYRPRSVIVGGVVSLLALAAWLILLLRSSASR